MLSTDVSIAMDWLMVATFASLALFVVIGLGAILIKMVKDLFNNEL